MSDVFFDLADPLGVIFAVLNQTIVGLEAQLNLLEDLLYGVVRRLSVDGLREGWIGAGHSGIKGRQQSIQVASILHQGVKLFIVLELGTCILQVRDLLFGGSVSEEGPVLVEQVEIESGSGKNTIVLFVVVIIELGHGTLHNFVLECRCARSGPYNY